MTITQYIAKLAKLEKDLIPFVQSILEKNEKIILGMIKLRLYNRGIDGDGNKILPDYQPSTIASKKEDGQKTSHVTLRDTGSFYNSLFLTYKRGLLQIDSMSDKKSPLVSKYGPAILDLTEQEHENIINNIITPEINKWFQKQFDASVEIEIN